VSSGEYQQAADKHVFQSQFKQILQQSDSDVAVGHKVTLKGTS